MEQSQLRVVPSPPALPLFSLPTPHPSPPPYPSTLPHPPHPSNGNLLLFTGGLKPKYLPSVYTLPVVEAGEADGLSTLVLY